MQRSIPELDGIRAVAILPVLGIHGSYGNLSGGFLGVDLFFVLSGFLITSLLLDEHRNTSRVHLGYFFARRALRIIPPLLVGVVIAVLLWKEGDLRVAIPAMLFFYANLLDYRELGVMTHTWSLSIEEQFYLVWPLAFALLAGRGSRLLLRVALGIAVAALVVRLALYWYGVDPEVIYRFTLARVDALAAGCIAAVWLQAKGAPRWSRVALPVLACVLVAAFAFARKEHPLTLTLGYSAFAAACATFIVSSLSGDDSHPVRRLLSSRVMRYIGRRSYGVYVYHLPIFMALESLRAPHDVVNFAWVTMLRLGVTFMIAELSFRTVEAWALGLKGRFYAKRTELE